MDVKVMSSKCRKRKPTLYTVTLIPKSRHPWFPHIDGDYGYAINNIPGAVLVLRRGLTYNFTFNNDNPEYSMYFTSDPVGGPMDNLYLDGTPPPFNNGTVTLYISDTTPHVFYYQDKNHKFSGGLIIVTSCNR
jgi:hypothetical protein